jgi:hypothetical protein
LKQEHDFSPPPDKRAAYSLWIAKVPGSLSVSLRAQPRDLAVSVHPIVNVCLALEAGDFSWFGAWVLGDDRPIII